MSNEVKHTPGPWFAGYPNDSENSEWGIHVGDHDGFVVADLCNDAPDDFDQEANAHLIAAAPELLAALIELVGWIPVGHWHTNAPQKAAEHARAAIAKATGDTP